MQWLNSSMYKYLLHKCLTSGVLQMCVLKKSFVIQSYELQVLLFTWGSYYTAFYTKLLKSYQEKKNNA